MIFWITHILAVGFLALEIFLLVVKRGRNSVTTGDQGTLQLVWILIGGGCLVGFLLAQKCLFFAGPKVWRSFFWRMDCCWRESSCESGPSCIWENFLR